MSRVSILLITAFLSFMPISELRGAIPFAVANGIAWYWVYPFTVILNALIAPVCWIFLATVHKFLYGASPEKGIRLYKNFFDRFVEKARGNISLKLERWGWLGITVFVAIPLPITGAWTGTIGAWVLGVSKKRTIIAVTLGVAAAGAIVTAVIVLGIEALNLFIRAEGFNTPPLWGG